MRRGACAQGDSGRQAFADELVRRGKATARRETGMRKKAVYGVLSAEPGRGSDVGPPIAQGGNKGLWRLLPLQDQGLLKRSAVLGALTPSGEHTEQRPRRPNRQPYCASGYARS